MAFKPHTGSTNGVQSLLLSGLGLLLSSRRFIGYGILSSASSLELNASKHLGLSVMALDHLDGRAHVLFQPINVGAVLEPERRIGVPETVDGPLTPDAILEQARLLQHLLKRLEVEDRLSVFMAEYVIVGLRVMPPAPQSLEIDAAEWLADGEALACLAR